jgi:DNA polymerase-3 subunit alpha
LIRIPKLVNQAKKLGMSAISLTDNCNLFAAVKLYNTAKSSGVKPIFGTEIALENEGKKSFLLLLCQNQQGILKVLF